MAEKYYNRQHIFYFLAGRVHPFPAHALFQTVLSHFGFLYTEQISHKKTIWLLVFIIVKCPTPFFQQGCI
ncbi:MAG: hypothetical protein CVU71_08145 [Deltaproteobacteria bacterium HGW-Deltaproteobacteria-6]|nr:MAG: hypothetical protein CVU71_08145 [Deltaproteobacteria bacterium HGW-Deltaproteobacteria-6]